MRPIERIFEAIREAEDGSESWTNYFDDEPTIQELILAAKKDILDTDIQEILTIEDLEYCEIENENKLVYGFFKRLKEEAKLAFE